MHENILCYVMKAIPILCSLELSHSCILTTAVSCRPRFCPVYRLQASAAKTSRFPQTISRRKNPRSDEFQQRKRAMTSQHGDGDGKGEAKKKNKNRTIASCLDEENLFMQQAPFEILNKYRSQLKCFRPCNKVNMPNPEATAARASCCQESSSESIVQIKNEELTSSILNAAELFSKHHLDCVEKLLGKIILLSSSFDNPLERVVKYFATALQERVDLERGQIDLEKITFCIEDCLASYQAAIVAAVHNLPSPQIIQFTAVQALLDSIGTAKKIHLVDFGINNGMHGSVMMQGLANRKNCPVELLKITAIGKLKDRLQEVGKRLTSFAESLNLPFLYKPVVSEAEVKEDSVEVDPHEVMAVYFGGYLWSQLAWPSHLRASLHFVRKLNPCVMVVNEFEANTNDPIFINRFREAFAFLTAMFDCIDTCLTGDNVTYRKILEEVIFWGAIRNIITAEDEERTHRHAKIEFWRRLFQEFGFVETQISETSLYQASLLISRNDRWNSCNVVLDGKCLIVGWKGTPLQSISAWKMTTDDEKSEQDVE